MASTSDDDGLIINENYVSNLTAQTDEMVVDLERERLEKVVNIQLVPIQILQSLRAKV